MSRSPTAGRPTIDEDGYPSPFAYWPREQVIDMNIAFAHAMFKARRLGLEKFTLGPIIDDSPMVPKVFSRVSIFSGVTSSATMCAEMGDAGYIAPVRWGK